VENTWLLKRSAGDDGPDLRLAAGAQVLGSATDADLVIANQTVSRRHARFHVDDRGVTIEDLGSTSGTFVNGQRIDDAVLVVSSATLKLGALKLELEPAPEREPAQYQPDQSLSSGESVLLGPATVGFLRSAGEEVSFSSGDVVVRRGEQQEYFYVVIEGVVELTLGDS